MYRSNYKENINEKINSLFSLQIIDKITYNIFFTIRKKTYKLNKQIEKYNGKEKWQFCEKYNYTLIYFYIIIHHFVGMIIFGTDR